MKQNEEENNGISWELEAVKKLHEVGYEHIGTSMLWNQERDKKGIDITSWDDDRYGKFPFNIQCKSSANVKYKKILDDIAEENTVGVVFQHNPQTGVQYAILKLEDFLQLIAKK